MSEVASIIVDLLAEGVSPALVARVAAALAERPSPPVVSSAPPGRTSKAERNARYYQAHRTEMAEKRLNKTTESALIQATETTESVLIQTPLAHVRDITLPVVLSGDFASLNARAISDPPTRAELDGLESELRLAAAPAIDPTATKLFVLAPIVALLTGKTGPPCDLEADVLPVIRAKAKSAKRHSIRSWDYFRTAILEARDQRLTENPQVEHLDDHRPRQNRTERDDRLSRCLAGAVAAADG